MRSWPDLSTHWPAEIDKMQSHIDKKIGIQAKRHV